VADLRSIFHHDFTTILHPFTTQNTTFCAPLEKQGNEGIAPQKNSAPHEI
jgi:hypothetical protein